MSSVYLSKHLNIFFSALYLRHLYHKKRTTAHNYYYTKGLGGIPSNATNANSCPISIFDYDRPTGNIEKTTNITHPTTTYTNYTSNTTEHPCGDAITSNKMTFINAETNALRRLRSSSSRTKTVNPYNVENKYYQNTNKYLHGRIRTFNQNANIYLRSGVATVKPGSLSALNNNVYRTNTLNYCVNGSKPVIYKPSNFKFAQQGGVDSGTLLLRKKHTSIQKTAVSLQSKYGNATMDALDYHANNDDKMTKKALYGFPLKSTPRFNKYDGTMSVCIPTTLTHMT